MPAKPCLDEELPLAVVIYRRFHRAEYVWEGGEVWRLGGLGGACLSGLAQDLANRGYRLEKTIGCMERWTR
jgi:hypothetical protein